MKKLSMFLMFSVLVLINSLTFAGGLRRKDLGSFGVTNSFIEIGNARNDGINRIYVQTTGGLNEYTWNGSSCSIVLVSNNGAAQGQIANGRNDGIKRLYCCPFETTGYGQGNIFEYTWDGSSWIKNQFGYIVSMGNPHVISIAVGNGRNDGVNRLYASAADGRVYEYSWNGSTWVYINMGGNRTGSAFIGKCKNDGLNRVYIASKYANDWPVDEYNWTGSTWTISMIGSVNGTPPIWTVSIGNCRNDGIDRLYLTDDYTRSVYEYGWTGSAWSTSNTGIIASTASYRYYTGPHICNFRNDGINRIYVSDSSLHEYSWTGTVWAKRDFTGDGYVPQPYAARTRTGDAMNDGSNRLYVINSSTASDHHCYEYTYDRTICDGILHHYSVSVPTGIVSGQNFSMGVYAKDVDSNTITTFSRTVNIIPLISGTTVQASGVLSISSPTLNSGVCTINNQNYNKYGKIMIAVSDSQGYFGKSIEIIVNVYDTTPPGAPAQVRDGTGSDISFTPFIKQLSANWDVSIDTESGIASYWYAIGTTLGGSDLIPWTDN